MTATAEASLLSLLDTPRPRDWEQARACAEAALDGRALPTTREEDWKYTDLRALQGLRLASPRLELGDVSHHILPESIGTRLVFSNGHFDPHASNTSALPPGVRLLPLAQASEAASLLGSLAIPGTGDLFAELNTARFTNGALIYVPKRVKVSAPLHVIFHAESREGACWSLPRLLVVLEPEADVTLVEEFTSQGAVLTSAVSELSLAPGSRMSHVRVQREGLEAFHFGTQVVKLGSDARYSQQSIHLGGRLSRHCPQVALSAEGASLELLGLAILAGNQLADTHACIDHRVPRASTRQLFKAIVDDQARAVFNGRILVRPGAQQTDARQQCRTLLLSDQARVDAKPELEIFADDVKCAHGAAVGQLDPEEVFYLQSRGMDIESARNLLVYGFAAEVLAAIEVPSLRRQLRQVLLERTQGKALPEHG